MPTTLVPFFLGNPSPSLTNLGLLLQSTPRGNSSYLLLPMANMATPAPRGWRPGAEVPASLAEGTLGAGPEVRKSGHHSPRLSHALPPLSPTFLGVSGAPSWPVASPWAGFPGGPLECKRPRLGRLDRPTPRPTVTPRYFLSPRRSSSIKGAGTGLAGLAGAEWRRRRGFSELCNKRPQARSWRF